MKIESSDQIVCIDATKEELEALRSLIDVAIQAQGVEGKFHVFGNGTLEVSIYCEED